jgi:hypothetical protein
MNNITEEQIIENKVYISKMRLVPIKQKNARDFVNNHHRHNKAPRGSIFQIGLEKDNKLIGCIMVGRPVSRHLDNGKTLEVNRTCIVGYHKNACSMLLGAAVRAGKALGYNKIITYTLPKESGSSLKGAGWTLLGESDIGNWNSRPNRQMQMFGDTKKKRWVKTLQKE